jgi:hypothetical protein
MKVYFTFFIYYSLFSPLTLFSPPDVGYCVACDVVYGDGAPLREMSKSRESPLSFMRGDRIFKFFTGRFSYYNFLCEFSRLSPWMKTSCRIIMLGYWSDISSVDTVRILQTANDHIVTSILLRSSTPIPFWIVYSMRPSCSWVSVKLQFFLTGCIDVTIRGVNLRRPRFANSWVYGRRTLSVIHNPTLPVKYGRLTME